MTIHLPKDLASSIRAEVLSGQFASAEEMVAAVVREYLRRLRGEAGQRGDAGGAGGHDYPGAEPSGQEVQRRLFEAGVLGQIKPPVTDLAPYRNRQAVPVEGEPPSETIIRERR